MVLFNILLICSQFANTLQAPLLTKTIETSIMAGEPANDFLFRLILFSATIGATVGALCIPSMHRFMEKGVSKLYQNNSVFETMIKSLKFSTLVHLKKSITLPHKNNFFRLRQFKEMRTKIILLNVLVYSFISASILSCLYAGYLQPNLRTTALSMSGIAGGLGAVGMMLFLQPHDAILTDKVIDGSIAEGHFRRHISLVVLARISGTILGQFIFIPMAHVVAFLAGII